MNLQGIKNRVRKVFAYTLTAILFLLISSFLVLQMPPVQNALVARYLRSFSGITGFKTTIKSFRMLWFDRLELEGVKVFDAENNKMIAVKKLMINFRLSHLLQHKDIDIDGIVVDSAEVFVTNINASPTSRYLNVNVFIDRINESFSSDSTTGGKAPAINIGEAYVTQSTFKYIDQDIDSITEGFDHNHFALHVDEGQLEHFVIRGDTTEFDLHTLIVQDEKTKFKVNQLSTFFRVSEQRMEYLNMNLQAGNSMIADTVIFTYNTLADLSDFIDKVNIHANLKKTTIDPKDLAVFAPGIDILGQLVKLNGVVDGKVNKIKFKQMDVVMGNTRLQGSLDMDGLPDFNETFINLNLKDSRLLLSDLSFLFKESTLNELEPLGRMSLNGQFIGYPNDFVATGTFNSKLGLIKSDINLKVDAVNFDKSVYSGNLSLFDFKLGEYLKDTTTFQKINVSGRVKGSGLKTSSADFTLDGDVKSIGILGYNYKNITTNARFASEFFSGVFNINDPNLKLKAHGSIDLREKRNIIKVQAVLDTAVLDNLKLTDRRISLRSNMDINIKGLQIDSLVGAANFSDFVIQYYDESLLLKNIHLNSEKKGRQRSINLETTLIDAQAKGNFLFSDITSDVETLIQEILLNVINDRKYIDQYYRAKIITPKNYEAQFNVLLKNVNSITKLLHVNMHVSPGTSIDGTFSSGHTTVFQIFSDIDTLEYNGSQFINNNIELTASKISDSTNVLAMAYVNSEKQFFGPNLQTKNLLAEGIWNKSHIEFGVDAEQSNQDNSMRLKGFVDFMHDSTIIQLLPSSLQILAQAWSFDPANRIVFANDDWRFRDVTMVAKNQSIGINGYLSKDSTKRISLEIENLDLSILNSVTGLKFTGVLDTKTDLTDFYTDPSVETVVFIDSLTVNNFLVGDITGKNKWITHEKRFGIDFSIERLKNRIVNISGFYKPSDEHSPLNINATLKEAELNILEPFLDDLFSRWGGSISGNYHIGGSINEPILEGEGDIANGQLMINYSKAQYRFTGKVGLNKNSLYFKQFELTDGFKHTCSIEGSIMHNNFQNTFINLTATFNNFQVMNTSARDNDLFYGQGYATGNINFSGPVSNLKITAQARSDKNTRIYIPIGGTSSVSKKEFIDFVNLSDTTFLKTFKKSLNNKINLSGLTFDLNLDITSDAYCEIIFDIKSGDIIRGRGQGDLQLQLDTKGEFNMFGVFEFTQGWYNFTLYDIINKEFEIQKGSKISWYGDPYAGNLDIVASYNQLASFGPVLSDQTLATAMRRKYPVQVLLKLNGPMLSPTINFDIIAKDLPKSITVKGPSGVPTNVALDIEFNAFKSKLDEQELKKQVFSLIILRKFSPSDAFNTSGSLSNSVSELFSNQLSNWMTQVDQNLEINVDLGSFDQEAFTTFQLRMSYIFLNGRLRITRDGTFNNNTQQTNTTNNSTNASTIAGDWTVDYLLTADGKLKVKMYNRTNVNPILNTLGTQSTFTTGVSLFYSQSFNEVSDLLRSARNKRRREMEKEKLNAEAIKEDDGS